MSVDNKKYKIALPDGRTTVWTQEQFDKQGEALLSKYPDANIVTSEDYDPSASYEAGVAYGIQTPDGRSTYWDAEQFGKQGEALMSKYPDAKITVYNDASKSYWRQKAEEQKESMTRFDQDNHEFMFKHEMDKILYDSGEGNITEDAYLADDAKYNELATLKKKLQADYSNNPYVQAIYKTEAQYSDGKAAEYDSIRENMRGDNPFLGASRQMQSGTEAENDEYMLYGQAKDLARNTAKTFAVETAKAPGENGFIDYLRNYGKAYADVFSDPDFWSRGITEISRNLNLRDIMQKLESKGINLNEVTEKQLDENLTGAEKALLSEFVRNVYAKATRAADMAPGYTAGQVSAESIGFMAEFLATGAIGRALGAGIGAAEEASSAGLRSWIARELRKGSADAIESSVKRSLVNSLTKGGKVALTQGMKNVVSGASRAASGAYSGIARPVEQAIWHTALQPSTYRQISENLTQIDNNGELISAGNAIWGGVLDQMVENWSETMGGAVETVLGIPFKAAGWAGEKVLGRTSLGQWGKWLADSQAARVLHDAGFNGLIGEMGEEWLGNAARVGLGIMSKDDFKDFASWHDQLEMAASFAPMSLFGLGSSTYAAARQAKEYKQTAEAMRGVLNRAGMTEDEISDIMDTKHTKKEIADALTPVIQRIVHGRQDNTTATEDYITTLKFAQASAMNEVVATAQSIEKEKEREMVRRGIGEELGATSEGDERGRFTHIMKTDRLDADGNPYELEAVTTVKDADGAEWFYMGDNGSQVVLKKRGENGGKPMFLSQEQYAQRVESGEYTETTQLATQFLDEEAEKIRTAEEQARTNQEVQDRYTALLNVFSQNPDINLGTEDAPMNGRVTGIGRDGIIVDFSQPVLLNGVTRQIHKISLEQAGNAVGIDTAMRGDEQRERDSIDQEYFNRQKVSAYNKTYAGKEFTLDGEPYRFVRMFEAPYLDESGTEQVKVTATDARGEDVEVVLPLEELQSQALTPQEQTRSDADQDEAGARVITETTGSLKDFRGNDIPMRINEKTGEEEVDKREFKKRDPEAYYRWNDSRRGGNTSDSMEAIQADITAKTAEKDSLAAQRQGETDPDMRDELEGQINRLNNEINLLAGIYHKYDAAGNFQNAQRQYAEKFADVERRMLNAKTQDQYDELVTIQRELTKDYFTEMQDAAYTMTLNQRTVELQSALNEIADVPVQVVTMAQIEEVMRGDNASEDAIAKVLDKIADIQRRNMVEGKSYALDGLHYNGKVYIFAEGNRNIDDARVTYYHERQHDINKRNPAAVDAVLVLADNNHDALFQTLTAIIGDAGTYRKSDERTLADEIVAFTMEKAWTNPEYVDELRALGLSDELINIISSEYGRQQGTSEDLDSGSGDRTARNSDSGQADYRIDEQAQRGESGDEQLGSAQPGVEAEEPIGSITPETAAELADKGLVMDGGAVMSADLSALKQAVGYLTPNEKSPEREIVEYSVRTRKAWADNYRKYPDSEERVIRALENLAERMAADELVSGVISQGDYKYGKKDKGSFAGPLRTNIEYIVTFDMDTTCPRTFQYLNYVKQIENRIGRPLTQTECIQLTEMMRMYGQQIPCVYCYSENKRQALKQYYTDFMTARHAVLNAATDEEALEYMYGHGTSKAARESKDPAVALNEAAYKVFLQWRSERRTAYNPSLKMLWFQYSNDRNVVLNVLDQLYADGRIMTDLNDDVIAAVVDTELRINDPAAVKVVEDIVSEWKWDAIEGREHSDFTPVEEDDLVVDPRTLSLWREMTSYAKSASQAKSVLRYIPYTDELKKLSQEQKDYINGMGGVRMHSSNDFRIDYVFDYFQFMADMAANKMFGHTYTKSPEFVRIFGNSGYKINMSIAAYEDENGNIRMNEDEGFNWDVAKELRNAFPNAGVMLMATSDNQIQMALDSDWIDMFIPFHASSLPKAVWYNMRAWKDYTTVQNEAFLNGDEMRAALISDGVELPKNIKAADVERMYLEHFNIKTIIGTAGKQKGKRLRPHFLPGPTVVDGQYVPGHDNDTMRYLQLCREYGVHPRFYGIKVKNAEGKTIDITEHPNYIKCIKETARTDSPQTAVRFNFDQPSEALGGKTPIEYAFDELQTRAAVEMQAAGSPVRDIYKSLEQDAFGIVPQFIDTIIKHKEKTGKDYPIDYITPDSRKWFLTERKALEEAYKDIETIPYHRNEYDIEGEPVKTRVTEKSDDAQKIEQQKALDFINGTRSFAEEGGDIRYSIRTKPAPKSTGIGYKVFYLKDGKLYPPMVANPGGADTPVGVWLDADAAPQAAASKTGRKKVKAGGKGTQGGSGTLAYRPGWHLGEIPYALQFNRGPKVDNPLGITGKNGKVIKVGKYFPANFVWAEVEYAKDVDYQDEAMSYGYNGAGNFQHSLAGLPKIPVDGSYTYRTNANPATDPWIITGAMKVNRVLTDSEVDELVRQAGREPQLREGKTEETRDVRENNEPSFRVVNDNQQVFISNALASLDKIPMKSGNAQAWINKIQQAGGLKKEEDKWMGLTDWLKEQKGNISKEDVAEFIREHQVQIEEVKYGTTPINTDYSGAIAGEKGVEFRDRFLDAFNVYLEEGDEDMGIPDRFRSELVNDEEAMDLYNENHEDKVSLDEEGYLDNVAQDKVMTWGDEILDAVTGTGEKPVNSTRMSYTTDGLENYREIALVVPTIEPYKESDDVHFGDAGEGRAVAWSRFGDAVDKDGNKVLVIDEIQSKRHQDAKENGYSEKDIPSKMDAYLAKEKAFEDYDRVFAELSGKYSEEDVREMLMSEEDNASYKDVLEKRKEANRIYNLAISRVPDAPFRDSWDALAMKRMLRFAAEEGYDKIAWTSGQMQSDRYDLTKVLDDFYYKPNGDGTYKVSAALNQRRTGYTEYSDLNYDSLTVDRIGEIFGKEIAAKVSEGRGRKGYSHNDERDWITFSGRDLKMANEGMRYFYDQKLVNWMNKYGKKWGVQVADLTLPGLENKEGWHSVDVTSEMKESVMEGQPMFRATEVAGNPSLIAVHNLTENDLLDAFDLGGFPMPSIAITKADIGHTDFGDISLVFGKETINPKNRKNKVYSGDAWTPTFPTINYKLNEDKASDIATRARKVGDLPLFNPSHFNSVNYEGRIEDFGARSLIEEFKNDYNAKQFYLAEQGNPVREYEMHEVEKYTEENVRRIKELLDKIGLENLKGVDRNLTPEILQVVKGFLDAVGDVDDSRIKRIARNYVVHAIDYATNGNRTTEIDYDATHRKIDERIDQSAFEKWLEDLFSGIVEKRGIRNEVDMFTPIGNRRAWEKLYDEVTLDNVVKAMSKKPERGGSGFFGGNIFGASFKTYNSIADIRKDAARRMAVVDSEELQKQKDDILNRLSNVKVTEKELGVGEMFDLTTNIKDAVAKSHTAEGIHGYLKDYYPDITMDAAQEIADIVKDIQSISTKYFEAKPYRAVGFDEVKLAVVPEDASQAIVDGLQERGVPVRTYEKDNQQERMDIISNATEEMGLRFRTVEITPETRDEMEQIKALARLNGTYLKAPNGADTKLTPEQWAMVRTKAFKAWFGDWENDPENASKIVDENGEPMVVYRGQNWDKQDGKMTSGLFVSLDEDFAEGYGDVKPLFVRSVNPFNGEKDAESLRQFVEENFDELQAEYEAFFDEEEGYEDVDSLMDALNENWWIAYEYSDILRNEIIRRGYDSIFIREDADNIWLTSPDQIKSAEPFTFDDNGNLIPLSERFNTESDDIRFRISPEQDQEFRKSYEDGDVAKAIEMLDAAAIAAGYDAKAFHGTEKGFNVFQADYRTGGNFFTPQEDAAKAYADAQSSGNGGVVIPVYLNLGKTFEIDAKGSQWDEVPVEWEVDSREDDYDEFFDSYGDAEREALKHPDAVISSSGISDTNDIAKRAKNDGYDSVIIRNVYDPGDSSFDSMQDDIVIFTPSRIKSAEPFTFDDDGDLIPLSQRFNPESDDIRFRSAEHGFYNGMSNDDFFDKVSEMSDFGSGGASRLISALEEHYGGELESLSNGARMAINDGRLPFPGPKFSGADGEYHHIAFIKDGERVTEAVPFDTMENVRSHGISLRVTSRQDDGYSRPDGLSDAEMADRKRNAMSGLQDFDLEAVADMLMKIFEEVPEEIRAVITDNAASTGYNFGKAAVNYFAALAERDELNDGERNAIAIMRDNLKEMLGIDNLSLDDALWSLYRTSTAGERDLLTAARKAIVADRLGHSPADEARRREIDDELRFSIRREMESMSAADMYNKATSYYMNRLKESFVDMNESVNDLVTAIEKATGMKAEAFEDIRLALNQQSSKGLAAMSKYTSDYLEPLWAQIDTVMKATGMSYDDVVRYVMLKHAVERNDVFAKRDAKSFYRAEFDKVVGPLMADRKKLEKDRKKALADGDITTADVCDGKIQAIDVQVAAEQKKLDRHNVMVDNGTAAKYKEFREQDYGGLTSMYSEYPGLLPRDRYKTDEEYNQAARKVRKPIYQTVAEMEVAALGEVDAFERRASGDEFDKLWEKINAATKATLESQYKSNVISKDQYMAVRDEFKYYVPLRGFKDTTAEDIWSYYNTSHSGDFSPALLGAKGRRTEAENPFNWIGTMASSAIAQNMKNESKLALYYFIANRPDQDLMSIKDVWYQFDPTATAEYQQKNPGSIKRVFREVHPPFNESLNADSAKNAYDLWEENMRQQAKNGLAFRGSNSLKVGDDVVFIGAGEAAQHIISLKLRGKEVSLILNANPRAAQAINGLLNIETEGGYQKIFGPVLRWMSAVNTSYNPEFWISNMQRDILFALMGTSIKGDSTSKFLGNLVNPKKIMRMMKAYEEGTLGNSEVENYYREFAESGAITGFTVVSGNEVWEKKIAEFLDPSIWDKIQNSGFMMFWQNLGEAVEQMTRFSAYMSARKSGKDIVEATNAAKEISVNFNRKGSGKHISVEELDKLTRKDGSRLNKTQKAGVYLMSLIPAYGRRAVMFFNAAIQGLNAMYKLWKKNPKRFTGWMTGYFALGVIQAVLHALFDDDDDYLDMPDYTRRNNLLIGYNGIYLKWAMPQEARAFYAFGDMAVNHIMGREPNKNLVLEMGNAIADMLPLSATDGVTGLLPSAAQPLVELYTNKDFTGARIYNDMKYLSEDERSKTPKYANALPQTGKIFVNVTEFLNYITGGSEWDAGYINVHPEAIQHVVEGAGGGLLTTINKAWETVGGAIDAAAGLDVTGEKLSVRRFPFLNRLLEVNDERSRNSHVSELFYYYKSEAEHTRTKMSKMKKAGDSDGLSELVESREYEIYTIYKSYEKLMKRYDEQIKIEEDMDEKKALMREQDEYRKEMIYEISKLE